MCTPGSLKNSRKTSCIKGKIRIHNFPPHESAAPPEKWIGICSGRNDRETAAINRVMIKTPQESLLLNKNFIKNFISSHLRCYYSTRRPKKPAIALIIIRIFLIALLFCDTIDPISGGRHFATSYSVRHCGSYLLRFQGQDQPLVTTEKI